MPDPAPVADPKAATPEDEALKALAVLTPEDRAAVEKLAAAPPVSDGSVVTVKLAYPVDTFDTGVEGVGVLTRVPTEIPQSSLAAVLAAARKSKVTVTQPEEK